MKKAQLQDVEALDIYKAFSKAELSSSKHINYFPVYTDLFEKFRGTSITFVEIGVSSGGSLFMWRDYLGPQARIIGVEFNPLAKQLEKYDFEIYIGNQSDPGFWDTFFQTVGDVDIVLDDGGHTYEQQIATAISCVPKIRDGGLLVVEDTHTSYMEGFGYPSKYTFISWIKNICDKVNYRFPLSAESQDPFGLSRKVWSICFYESIVAMHINAKRCLVNTPILNNQRSLNLTDFRHADVKNALGIFALQEQPIYSDTKKTGALNGLRRFVSKRAVRLMVLYRLYKTKRWFV